MNFARGRSDSWFRIGSLEITTTLLLVLGGAAMAVVNTIIPLAGLLAFSGPTVLAGQWWRLVTWPLASVLSLGTALTLLMLWYFGTDIEARIGRHQMAAFYGSIAVVLTGVFGIFAGFAPFLGVASLAGLGFIQFIVLLVWIAENPRRPFFFNIPAWVVGVIIVGVEFLSLVGARAFGLLLPLVGSVILSAFVARRFGLLGDFSGLVKARKPKPVRRPKFTEVKQQHQQMRDANQRASDRARADELLDRFNERGLSASEREELNAIRARMRGEA